MTVLAATASPKERDQLLAGCRTRVLRVPGTGPPIVLLHGFADSADTWRPLIGHLAERGRGALALDLPHFGCAERPRQTGPLLDLCERVASAATVASAAQAGQDVVLVGSSLGGLVALRAAQDPDLPVRAVVAIGPAGFGTQPWVAALHRASAAVALASRAPLPHGLSQALIGEAYSRLCTRRGIEPDTRARFCEHVGPGDLGRILRLGRQVLREIAQPGVADIRRVNAPVTLIWGGHDALCPPAGATIVVAQRPETKLHLHDAAGHCGHLDDAGAGRRDHRGGLIGVPQPYRERLQLDREPRTPTLSPRLIGQPPRTVSLVEVRGKYATAGNIRSTYLAALSPR